MKQLSLDNVRAFVTVVDAGGYAKAGELLGRSQPAISLQIKRLETQLGQKLFGKEGQRQVLNGAGKRLLSSARQLLALNDNVFREFEQQPLSGRVRLGIPSEFATSVLPSIVGAFSQAYPDVSLEVTSALSKQLLSNDRKDDFDLVLALKDQTTPQVHQSLLLDELVWVGSSDKVWEQEPLPLVVAPEGCIYRKRMVERLRDKGRKWRVSYTNADITGISAALNAGLGITALAKRTVPPGLKMLKSTTLPPLGKVGIHLQLNRDAEAVQRLGDFIRQRLV